MEIERLQARMSKDLEGYPGPEARLIYLAGYADTLFSAMVEDTRLTGQRPALFAHVVAWREVYYEVISFKPSFCQGMDQAKSELYQS